MIEVLLVAMLSFAEPENDYLSETTVSLGECVMLCDAPDYDPNADKGSAH